MSPFCTVQISLWVFSTSVYGKNRSSKIIQIRLQVELTGLRNPWRQIHPWEVSGLVGDLRSCLAKAFRRDACAEPLREKPGPGKGSWILEETDFLKPDQFQDFVCQQKGSCLCLEVFISLLAPRLFLRAVIMSLAALLLSGAWGRADSSVPICLLVGGEEWATFWLLMFHILKRRHD